LYENDGIFDRFDAKFSPTGKYVSTGSYHEQFQIIDVAHHRNSTLTANFLQRRFESNEIIREYDENGRHLEPSYSTPFKSINFQNKIINTSWHPKVDCLAAAN
jgi:hypothetical protein